MLNSLYIQIDCIGLVILGYMFWYNRYIYKNKKTQKIFSGMLVVSAVMMTTELVMWVFDGRSGVAVWLILRLSALIFHAAAVMIAALWLVYCDFRILGEIGRQKRLTIYIIPWILCVFFLIIDVKNHFVFCYDSNNIFHRGVLYSAYMTIMPGYLVSSVIIIAARLGKMTWIQRSDAAALVQFAIPPIIASAVQWKNYGMPMVPISLVISLLIIFFQRQSELVMVDGLTNLDNHREFERQFEQKLQNIGKGDVLFLIVMDVDRFKQINDTFGHSVGNEALIKIADILKRNSKYGDCTARIGGDEFLITGQRKTNEDVEELCRKICDELHLENESGQNKYKISLSMGAAVFDDDRHRNASDMFAEADAEMYKQKRKIQER